MTDGTVRPPEGFANHISSTPTAHIYHQVTGNWFTPNLFYWTPINAPTDFKPYGGFVTLEACIKHHDETIAQEPIVDNVIYVDFRIK